MIGTSLGPYEVIEQLGAGGMGEVYRARDTRLERDVAIKVLGPDFARHEDRVRRFTVEAQATGALNHPNILAVHDIGTHDGAPYLVAELLEGETLRDRMDGGRLPLSKVLDLASQVASGLAAAHAKGITHRDIKPENLFVTTDGRAKILDFGLAKQQGDIGDSATRMETATEAGVVLGTVGYMSPEQVRGDAADARSDIFSFGVVLYEMLSGKRPFVGDSAVETMNAILTADPPDIAATDRPLPPALERVVRHCVEKGPDERFQSARDLAFALDAMSDPSGSTSTVAAARASAAATRPKVRVPMALVAVGFAAGLVISAIFAAPSAPPAAVVYTRLASEAASESMPAWSPNGDQVAYVRVVDGLRQVFVRSLDVENPRQLTRGALHGMQPFWWPDSTRVGFVGAGGIYAVSVVGSGEPALIQPGRFHDATMSPDGTLAAWRVVDDGAGAIATVVVASPADGELREYAPAPFKMRQELTTNALSFSPDGTKVLLSAYDASATPQFWLLPMPAGESDPVRLSIPELPVRRADDVAWLPDSRRFIIPAQPEGTAERQLWLADIDGTPAKQLTATLDDFGSPDVSPDGTRVVFTAGKADYDAAEIPLDGGPLRSVLATSADEVAAVWIPGTPRFLYNTQRSGRYEIRVRNVETGRDDLVFADPEGRRVGGATPSPDGLYVAFQTVPDVEVWIKPIEGGPASNITEDGAIELGAAWSPDSTRIATYRLEDDQVSLRISTVNSTAPPVDIAFEADADGEPEWSPDGGWIATPLGPSGGVVLMSPDGGSRRTLLAGLYAPAVAWSEDSLTLYAPVRNPESRRFELLAVDVETDTRIVRATLPTDVMVSSGGSPSLRLSFNADRTALLTTIARTNYDLWMMDNFLPPPTGWQRWFGRR